MKRALEDALAVVVAIAIPAALLAAVGLAFSALGSAAFWRNWPEDAQRALWFAAILGALALALYVIRQLMRVATWTRIR